MKLKYIHDESSRLDRYLASLQLPELISRNFVEKLISAGNVRVDGKHVKKNHLLQYNDNIEIIVPEPERLKAEPENIPIDIVYEDEYFAVINKQAGINVHPTPGNYNGTIVNAVLYHFGKNLANHDDDLRPGIVHRLDKNTSGLMLIAKDNKTLNLLNNIFSNREIRKYYKAITLGMPRDNEGTISARIGRSAKDRTKMTIRSSGRHAITLYRVEKTYNYFSFMDICLQTGRTHQIRVHLNYINTPILGDEDYGANKFKNILPHNLQKKVKYYVDRHLKRQALHAYKLEFIHPITKKEICFQTDLPYDINNCLNWLESLFIMTDYSS